jgi:uncharacterized membrane protein YraQ (UPF0718 family)
MMDTVMGIGAGLFLRTATVLIEAAPYLLLGFLLAGLAAEAVGVAGVRWCLGGGRVAAAGKAWAVGLALPVCALGVLPLAEELRRAGVRRSALISFILAAPMFHPASLAFGLSVLEPSSLLFLVMSSLAVACVTGCLVDRLSPAETGPERATTRAPRGRVTASLAHAARSATSGPSWRLIGLGLIGAGVVSALTSEGDWADSFFAGDPLAIPRALVGTAPSYLTAEGVIALGPEMRKFDQAFGVFVLFLTLGAGLTLGTFGFIARALGARRAVITLTALLLVSASCAFAFNGLVSRAGTINPDNDHFARLGNPFRDHAGPPNLAFELGRLADGTEPSRWVSLGLLAALVVAGAVCRARGITPESIRGPLPEIATSDQANATGAWRRLAVPLGMIALTLMGVGLYVVYPPPSELLADIQIVKGDLYGEIAGPTPAPALYQLDRWERLAGQLRVSSSIRLAPPDAATLDRERSLREQLKVLREEIAGGRREAARARFLKLQALMREVSAGYRGP